MNASTRRRSRRTLLARLGRGSGLAGLAPAVVTAAAACGQDVAPAPVQQVSGRIVHWSTADFETPTGYLENLHLAALAWRRFDR